MRELHVVATSEDGRHVVLATSKTASSGGFKVAIDERLAAAVRGDLPRPGEERPAEVTPKEIQARLRAGESPEEIAASAGVPVTKIERYAGPVLSERERVLEQARAGFVSRSRLGESALPLGEAVDRHLADTVGVRLETVQWSARREEVGTWLVELSYVSQARRRTAVWRYDVAHREVTATDAASAALAHVDPSGRRSRSPEHELAMAHLPARRPARRAAAPKKAAAKAVPAKAAAKVAAKKVAARPTPPVRVAAPVPRAAAPARAAQTAADKAALAKAARAEKARVAAQERAAKAAAEAAAKAAKAAEAAAAREARAAEKRAAEQAAQRKAQAEAARKAKAAEERKAKAEAARKAKAAEERKAKADAARKAKAAEERKKAAAKKAAAQKAAAAKAAKAAAAQAAEEVPPGPPTLRVVGSDEPVAPTRAPKAPPAAARTAPARAAGQRASVPGWADVLLSTAPVARPEADED